MTWAILSINNKGGTGKSTIAVEMARGLRDRGYDVGVMDADIDSANLATRLGCDKKVTFKGDHIIEPVDHDGMKLYSMENAFSESTFSQSGEFFKEVIDNMINHSDWGEMDYMVVDCPPGSSDVFEELVRALRPSIKGAVSVGQPDAVDDTARLVKVCNHNWVPIIGFLENMSGIVSDGEIVEHNGEPVYPFGEGTIEQFSDKIGGQFLGDIPICIEGTEISEYADDTIENMLDAIEESDGGKIPDDNTGDPGFIKNLWKIINDGLDEMNKRYDMNQIQDKFGVENREPLIMELEISDAGMVSRKILGSIVLTVDDGQIRPMKKKKAKRAGYSVEGGMSISSQDLYDSIRGEKKVMRSATGEITTENYSITKAVQMGDAKVWGERTINRLAVLDKILSEVVDMEEMRELVSD